MYTNVPNHQPDIIHKIKTDSFTDINSPTIRAARVCRVLDLGALGGAAPGISCATLAGCDPGSPSPSSKPSVFGRGKVMENLVGTCQNPLTGLNHQVNTCGTSTSSKLHANNVENIWKYNFVDMVPSYPKKNPRTTFDLSPPAISHSDALPTKHGSGFFIAMLSYQWVSV